ncbi:UPF0280 family protein [Thermodesulforhabdus norvegica]|uniref:Uncharacterized protein n=1 Tax=Thermodesulforhabdus norvegica TaxID=39841 RepID=A0A1I4R7I0_9BACT|nr:UPF0280 family protein [Thermodesulforhabdus norvegica]SFM48262.1 hypothetical protein SAMN05660836_00452 [Thermodesulforhabdus norvegica]
MGVIGKESRFYRFWHASGKGTAYEVRFRQTDLWIRSSEDFSKLVLKVVMDAHCQIMAYAKKNSRFLTSLRPLPWDPLAPPIVRKMLRAADFAGVGPMASVAGAIAECVGVEIRRIDPAGDVIVENGGDCFLFSAHDPIIGLYGGNIRLRVKLPSEKLPLCVCSSSATMGHSLSLGKADLVTIFSSDGALADAAATAVCNSIHSPDDLEPVVGEWGLRPEIYAVIAIIDGQVGLFGGIELV